MPPVGQDRTVFFASSTCANLGGGIFGRGQIWKLPAALELRAANNNGDISIPNAEWSSSTYVDNVNGFRAQTVNGNQLADHSTVGDLPFRCAAIPLQINSIIIIPLDKPQDGSDAGKTTNHDTKANGAIVK
jgi:hypothetical protein